MQSNNVKSTNLKEIKRVLILIMFLNYLVAGIKIVVGYLSNSHAVTSDGFHSMSDGLNNIIGIIALGYAYKPADNDHPYGHKKIESILSLLIGLVLLYLSFTIAKNSIVSFNDGVAVNLSIVSIATMLFTLILNVFVTRYERKKGQELNSSFLISDAAHTMSDVYVTISVIVSMIGIKYFNLPTYFDSIMSLVVTIFILKAGFEIIIDSVKILTDSKIIDDEQIKEIVDSFPAVLNSHYIKSRGFEDDAYVDLHIVVNPKMTVEIAHQLSHDIETAIQKKVNPNTAVIIHIEPLDDATRKYIDSSKLEQQLNSEKKEM